MLSLLLSIALSLTPTEGVSLKQYVKEVSEVKGLDPSLVESILETENPFLDEKYININTNGTADLGLWQLNSKYLWSDFVPRYWVASETFNPFDWKHSTYIAITHISWLYNNSYDIKKTILAYNCGIGAVQKKRIPESSKAYAQKVMKKYKQKQKASL